MANESYLKSTSGILKILEFVSMIKYTEDHFEANFWQFQHLLPNHNVNKSPSLEKVLEIHQSSQQISTFTLYIFNRSAWVSYYVIFLSLVTMKKRGKDQRNLTKNFYQNSKKVSCCKCISNKCWRENSRPF